MDTFAGKEFDGAREKSDAKTTDFGRALAFLGFIDKTRTND